MLAVEAQDKLKKALRKIGQNIENHSMMSPHDFTNEDISLLYSLGVNLYEQGDYTQAKTVFQRLVLAKPHEKKFWMALGASLQMKKHYQEALTSWAMASLIQDEDPTPHFHAAECLLCLEDKTQAKKALQEAKKRSENDPLLEKKIQALELAWDITY
ncbi:MAG: SycD/LcrH family type III secretion system chaperone [Chlamydiota bacterium]